jgi:hypothetical protein
MALSFTGSAHSLMEVIRGEAKKGVCLPQGVN